MKITQKEFPLLYEVTPHCNGCIKKKCWNGVNITYENNGDFKDLDR